MKKILVLGSLGMAGHVMYQYLQQSQYEVVGVARSEGFSVDRVLDVADFGALRELLRDIRPDVVVNCVGVLVSGANSDICNAILLNSYLPNLLAKEGLNLGFKLVHISTDCVFSGLEGGYIEAAFRDGDDNYARTKALGEVNDVRNLTLRTSIIGPELKSTGVGLMHWFLSQRDSVSGYTMAFWSGLTTLELARVVDFSLCNDLNGLVHPVPPSRISKFDLLCEIKSVWELDIAIAKNDEYRVDKSLVATRKEFSYSVPSYREMLLEMKNWMDANSTFYSHYQ